VRAGRRREPGHVATAAVVAAARRLLQQCLQRFQEAERAWFGGGEKEQARTERVPLRPGCFGGLGGVAGGFRF
jgi:hypothetical protein